MVTRSMRSLALAALVMGSLAACGTSVRGGGGGEDPPVPPVSTTRYPGHGFVVHEWGTDTVVVGSDGSLQRGLHHEEEDLPAFVYDRLKAGQLPGSTSVEIKMETPVTYFYSDVPRTVNVAVDFPQGIFTQWYPAVLGFAPMIAGPGSRYDVTDYTDPALDPAFSFNSPTCAQKYGTIADGLLDWGAVEVLARDAAPAVPDAPLDAYTWSYARDVAANHVRIAGAPGAEAPQHEKFLFYRGLGRFDLPVKVTASPGGAVHLANGWTDTIGHVFAVNVGGGRGAFAIPKGDLAAGGALELTVPSLEGAADTAAFADDLGKAVHGALGETGLYDDEATAMVNTWKRQWFTTPGVRLLYLIPEAWTDQSIPLTLAPAPDAVVRVMMIRVEILTPEVEQLDTAAAAKLASAATEGEAKAYFAALGRFAEPRLRRALALLGEPAYGEAFLASITSADTRAAAGE